MMKTRTYIKAEHQPGHQGGITLIELLVALAIGSFLIIGAVQIYNQSRQAFVVNESIARVQETANFAMDTIEADLRMASHWGRTSRVFSIDGRSIGGTANPAGLDAPTGCGDAWALDLVLTVDGDDNTYALACSADGGAQANSDSLTIRRASVQPAAVEAGRLQIQTTRIQGALFDDGTVPGEFSTAINAATGLPNSATHNLIVNTYYVAADSDLIPGVPTLRRKTLGVVGGAPGIIDQEVAPGVENLQVQFGIDLDEDNTVDTYVDPGDEIYDPTAAGFVPGAKIITARIWLIVRGLTPEVGIQQVQGFQAGDQDFGVPADEYRRMMVSKTILLRNSRT